MGGWRPVVDLSLLNKVIQLTEFKMETEISVITADRKRDFLASVDLKDAYFQIPVHPASRRLLQFIFEEKIFQFKILYVGLSTTPQVFARVFQVVSARAHSREICLLRYLDNWLLLASSPRLLS